VLPSKIMPKKTHSILMNLFDLENVRVDDIMTPRSQVEGLDLSQSPDLFFRQLRTAHHTKLLVYEGEKNNVKGILHVRKAVGFVFDPNDDDEVTRAAVRELLTEPYYIPAATPVFQQLQFFQENRERFGVVVDEYGQLQGLVTLEDILEQLIGQFTSNAPIHAVERYQWVSDPAVVEGALVEGSAAPVAAPAYAVVEGASPLRELNRQLGLQLPLDGPKTLSGLIVEHLEDIPEAGVSLKIGPCVMEIIHTEDRVVKTVKLSRPIAETA
jgi:Mg2+/Co2+ transporter CorB